MITIAWRLERAALVRRLCLAHMLWSRAEQTRRVRKLFPDASIDWRSIAVYLSNCAALPAPDALDRPDRAQWQKTVDRLKRWTDDSEVPPQDAALVLAASCILTRWLTRNPTALP